MQKRCELMQWTAFNFVIRRALERTTNNKNNTKFYLSDLSTEQNTIQNKTFVHYLLSV